MKNIIKLSIIFLLIFNVFSVFALTVSAGDSTPAQPTGLLPTPNGPPCPAGTTNCGNYTLNDMLSVVLKISEFILGIVGSLALLAFIVGGLMWMLSGGKAELVERGKQTIIGAVVGLAIVFTSFMIIQIVYSALGIEKAAGGKWAVSSWFIK
jgi:hypothetical protein